MAIGFSELNLAMMGIDFGMIIALLPLRKELQTRIKLKESKELLKNESPINWSKFVLLFSVFSFFSFLSYEILIRSSFVVDSLINNALLVWGFGFLIFAFILISRLTVFMYEPSSKMNIIAGKAIHIFGEVFIRVVLIGFMTSLQIINAFMFGIIIQSAQLRPILAVDIFYGSTIILSFIAMFQIIWAILFRMSDQFKRKDAMIWGCFFAPWIVLAIFTALMVVGWS